MKTRLGRAKYVIGIDEAGRGPLAGPISFGFIRMEARAYQRYKSSKNSLPQGIDSKKLSEKNRERWFREIERMKDNDLVSYTTVFISAVEIDKIGLSNVIKRGIKLGLKKIQVATNQSLVLLDGGLKAPVEYTQRTIIKGDEKEKIIGLASIVAKVKRDKFMCQLAKKYPQYRLDLHKGYGTKMHRENIQKNGLSKIHRRTFCRSILTI